MKNEWPLSYIVYEAFAAPNREKAMERDFKTLSNLGYQGVELPGLYWFKTVDEVKAVVKLAWEYVFEFFDAIVPFAEKSEVFLTVEPVYEMVVRDYYTMMELFHRYDSKALAVNFDTANFNLYRNDLPWITRRFGKRVKHTHIHDSAGRPGARGDDFIYALIGQGTVDWKGWFHALKDIGYKGYLSIEFGSSGKWARDIMKYNLKQIAGMFKTSLETEVEMA